MEIVNENCFKLSDELYTNWKLFWMGKLVMITYEESFSEYLFYYNKQVWHGIYEIHQEPQYLEAISRKVMSMILNPDVCFIVLEDTTDQLVEKVIGKTLTGYDGTYWFSDKSKCKWESDYSGETYDREGFELGDTFMNYFTNSDIWKIEN